MYAMRKLTSMRAMLCDENECMGSIGMGLRMAAFGRRCSAINQICPHSSPLRKQPGGWGLPYKTDGDARRLA